MAKIVRQYCPTCAKTVAAEGPGVNHLLHLLISLFCCALWPFVWITIATNQTYNCRTCGTRTYASGAWLWVLRLAALAWVGVVCLIIYAISQARQTPAPKIEEPRPVQSIRSEPTEAPSAITPNAEPIQPVMPNEPEATAAQGTETETKTKPADTSKVEPDPQAAIASRKLSLAKPFLERGENKTAKKRLTEIVDQYPNTPAAVEAKQLLEKLD